MQKYENFIYYILRKNNVNESDIDDVAQEINLDLARNLKNYDREKGRFRTWLAVMIRSRSAQYFRKLKASNNKIDHYKSNQILLHTEDEGQVLNYIEKEWKDYITTQALQRIENTYHGKALDVFKRGLSGESIQDTALALDIAESSVYSYRQRVKKSLKTEVRKLILDLEGAVQ